MEQAVFKFCVNKHNGNRTLKAFTGNSNEILNSQDNAVAVISL